MELAAPDFTTGNAVAILPGSFHPPTIAHLGLAQAALARVDTVLFALPRAFPHKTYGRVALQDRLLVLQQLIASQPRFAVAIAESGLFAGMARELRLLRPQTSEIFLLCGRDAADRIVTWPYPEADPIERQLDDFQLLVAARDGVYTPPPDLQPRVLTLPAAANWDGISSTLVRQAIEAGEPWRHLVPGPIHHLVETLYSPSRLDSRNVRSR
jgi:nicotinic acid mononucleotide adenylyltransferase